MSDSAPHPDRDWDRLADLIRRAVLGESDAIDAVIRCVDQVLRTHQRDVRDVGIMEDRHDVHQEVRIKVIRGLPTLNYTSEGAFRAWVINILQHTTSDRRDYHWAGARDVRKTSAIQPSTDSQIRWPATPSRDPADLVEIDDLWTTIREIIARLPPTQQRFARLRFLERRSIRSVARMTGLTAGEGQRLNKKVSTIIARVLGSAYWSEDD